MAMPQYILNRKEAQNSICKPLSYDINKIICYHGGVYSENMKKSLEEIVKGF